MTSFSINSELFLGESSEIDALFLPVHVDDIQRSDTKSSWKSGFQNDLFHDEKTQLEDETSLKVSTQNGTCIKDQQVPGTSSVLMHAIITDSPDSSDRCYRATLCSIGVIIFIVVILVFGHKHIRSLLLWLEHVDPVVSLSVLGALFILISFPIAWGLSLLMVTSGYLYGFLYGPLAVTFCVTLGLSISTPTMRLLCLDYMRSKFYSHKVEAIINVVSGPHGMKIVALTRLTPIPFGLQNALFSLSSMSLPRYLISSVGGLVPMNVLNCYMGSTLRNMQDLMADDSNRLTGFFIFGSQILVTVILLWFVVRKARVELKKAMDGSEKSSPPLPHDDCLKTVYVENSS
ncbi:transmembrane protein 64 [Biomphalaria glabrata]|uniref:VTT domain-containing protein n=1 Tax=Biomphalaria glabrata TaxID=6526 RepID=A0A2C9M858_BIOGL|nr:transmembrane protein 64 [Biomphalaria glabrata]